MKRLMNLMLVLVAAVVLFAPSMSFAYNQAGVSLQPIDVKWLARGGCRIKVIPFVPRMVQ